MDDRGGGELERLLGRALAGLGLELVDLEVAPQRVLVTVDRPQGVDLDVLAGANHVISDVLDERPELAPRGPYGLEVSSPGLERPLRRPAQFRRAVGSRIALKTHPGADLPRRLEGVLVAADDEGIEVRLLDPAGGGGARTEAPDGAPGSPEEPAGVADGAAGAAREPGARLSYEQISSARTVFAWGSPAPRRAPASRAGAAERPRSQARKVARA